MSLLFYDSFTTYFISCLANQFCKDEAKVRQIHWKTNSKLDCVVCTVLSLLMEFSSITDDKTLWYVKCFFYCHIIFTNKTKGGPAMQPPYTDCQHPKGSCRLQKSSKDC